VVQCEIHRCRVGVRLGTWRKQTRYAPNVVTSSKAMAGTELMPIGELNMLI
jgi:hypothetical protein